MALCVRSTPVAGAVRSAATRPAAFKPLSVRRNAVRVAASKTEEAAAFEIGKLATLSAVASSWMFSGHAQAATELASVAAGDNRFNTILLLFLPALGWVAFNIFQPALNQLARQSEIKDEASSSTGPKSRKKRGVAGAVGLGAAMSLFAAQQADAATEMAQLAAGDNRLNTILLLFAPALAWVGFNMLQPALNQLNRQAEIKAEAAGATVSRKKRGVAGAVGLGAALSLFAAQQADAATEIAQLAAGDNRFGTIALLFVPALAWVGFNMLQPALNQLNRQAEIKAEAAGATVSRKKRGIAGAVGMGAALSMFAAQQADAATELAQLAAGDNRLNTILLLFAPALAWVGFNMLQPALNQLNRQAEIKAEAAGATVSRKKRGVAGAVGLGAALSLFAAQQADAATEIAQLAAGDNRFSTILTLFVPALAWVGFNMLQPALNQLNRQAEIKAEAAGAVAVKSRRR